MDATTCNWLQAESAALDAWEAKIAATRAALDRDYREPGQPAGAVTLTASVMGCGCATSDNADRHEVSCRKVEPRR